MPQQQDCMNMDPGSLTRMRIMMMLQGYLPLSQPRGTLVGQDEEMMNRLRGRDEQIDRLVRFRQDWGLPTGLHLLSCMTLISLNVVINSYAKEQ